MLLLTYVTIILYIAAWFLLEAGRLLCCILNVICKLWYLCLKLWYAILSKNEN